MAVFIGAIKKKREPKEGDRYEEGGKTYVYGRLLPVVPKSEQFQKSDKLIKIEQRAQREYWVNRRSTNSKVIQDLSDRWDKEVAKILGKKYHNGMIKYDNYDTPYTYQFSDILA